MSSLNNHSDVLINCATQLASKRLQLKTKSKGLVRKQIIREACLIALNNLGGNSDEHNIQWLMSEVGKKLNEIKKICSLQRQQEVFNQLQDELIENSFEQIRIEANEHILPIS